LKGVPKARDVVQKNILRLSATSFKGGIYQLNIIVKNQKAVLLKRLFDWN
jgi:hypothetical protein